MAQTLRTYSPQEVVATWAGYVELKNFADGTGIEVSRSVDNSTQAVGMGGDVGLTYNANKTGTIAFTIMQTGETNRILSAIQSEQDITGTLIRGDITVSDPSGSWLCIARNCHIMTAPTVTLGDDQNSKQWTFFAERIDFTDVPVGFISPNGETTRIQGAVDGMKSVSDALNAIL